MRTIVAGVEESERSLDALALARRIAGRSGGLLLVCAYPADALMSGDGGASYVRALRAQQRRRWRGWLASRVPRARGRRS